MKQNSVMNTQAQPTGDVWRLRSDLQFHWVDGGGQTGGYWVVKDPLATEWFCLSGIERRLLGLADGCRCLSELCRDAIQLLGPVESSVEAMVSFYSQARGKGLLIPVGHRGPVDKAITRSAATTRASSKRLDFGRLLAYRLPGINPNRIPSLPEFWRRITGSALVKGAMLVLAIVAVAIVFTRFDQLAFELALAWERRHGVWLIWVLFAIAAAKSIHELAHVAACRRVGAECREVGVMLLFGTPCLYCDVSDLWTVPQRARRIFVSAAGMLAELILAAMATVVWAVTEASILHDLALVIMVVCSLSTVMVNANPLLRYDGYFMLSDWIGVPNLARNAADQLGHQIRRMVWGQAEPPVPVHQLGRSLPPAVLLIYAVASSTYRLFVILMISLLVYHTTSEFGFGWLGVGLGGLLIGAMVLRSAKRILEQPSSEVGDSEPAGAGAIARPWWRRVRPVVVISTLVVLAVSLMLVPLPSRVVVPVMVVAAEQRDLHATEQGVLVRFTASGTMVDKGDVLFEFENEQLESQRRRAEAALEAATAVVQAWQSRRGGDPDRSTSLSTSLAVAIKRKQAAEQAYRQAVKRVMRLTIVAPSAGQFHHRDVRSGSVFDRGFRAGQVVNAGAPLGWVGHPDRRAGIALLDQGQIDFIHSGQLVRLRHGSLPTHDDIAVVRQVDRSAAETIAEELLAAEFLAAAQEDLRSSSAGEPKYLVGIEPLGQSWAGMPIRSVSPAEIATGNRSLWERTRRMIWSEFRGF